MVLLVGLSISLSFYSSTTETSTVLRTVTIISNQTVIRQFLTNLVSNQTVETTFTKTVNASIQPQKIVQLVLVKEVVENAVCLLEYTNESSTIYQFPTNATDQYFNATLARTTSITTITSYENITVDSLITYNTTTITSNCLITNGPSGNNSTSSCFCA